MEPIQHAYATKDPSKNSGKDRYLIQRDPVARYICENSIRLSPEQEGLIKETANQPGSRMLASADEMQFLQNLARSIRAKKTIDIGVYTGYSALTIALALPEDGKLIALDVNDTMPEVGRPFWKAAGVEHKIDLRIGAATDSLEKLCSDEKNLGTFDFVFVDADKTNYHNYHEYSLKLLRSGGVIVFDNMLWSGQVANPDDQSESTVALRNMAKFLHQDERVDVSFLSVGDGTYLAFKK